MNTLLFWIGGPHDGLLSSEPDLPIQDGDGVTCGCHNIRYEVVGHDDNGRWELWHPDFPVQQPEPTLSVAITA